MNDFDELEADLKQLRPATASPGLIKRVERDLGEVPSTVPGAGILPQRKARVNWFGLSMGGLAAAAVVLLLARASVDRTPRTQPRVAIATPAPAGASTSQPAPTLVPDGITRVVYQTRNEGLVFPSNDDQPVRRVRSLTRETLAFRDPTSGASLRVSYPTEDIRLIPVSGQ